MNRSDLFCFVVAEQNVHMTIKNIRRHSPILKAMEADGEIKIVGGIYDMNTGEVDFYNE